MKSASTIDVMLGLEARGGIKTKRQKSKALEAVRPYLEEQGHTGLELSLGYNLSHEEMSSVICGMRNPQQLHMTIKVLRKPSGLRGFK